MFKYKLFIDFLLIFGIISFFNSDINYSNNIVNDSNSISYNFTKEDIVDDSNVEEIVFDGLTMNELINKLDRNLYNELYGKGYLYATYSLEKNVDPYLAVAISLEETGCKWNCSNLVKYCNNVGGMIGSGCNGYSSWSSLDDGIRAFIDNISNNYVAYGLKTAYEMNAKYAENSMWASHVNNYINIIKKN